MKNILFDSSSSPIKRPYLSKLIKYTMLSKDQICLLESTFIKKRYVFTRNNIKKLCIECKVPYKSGLNYFVSKIKSNDNEIYLRTSELIKQLKSVNKVVDEVWDVFCKMDRN